MRGARSAMLGGALALGIASGVRAGPLEELDQLAVAPTDPDRMVLRYLHGGEGLVFSRDGGASWRALCADGIRPAGSMAPPVRLGRIALDADGVLYMATFTGLVRDDGAGCNWQVEGPFADQWVTDVVTHPGDPRILYATTSNAGPDAENGVYRRDADGAWHAVGTQDAILIGRLHVVDLGKGKLRMYERAVRGMFGTTPNFRPRYLVRSSDDLGETWAEHEFGDTEGVMEVEAVDPTNADRIVVSLRFEAEEAGATKPSRDRVLVSDDRGKSFSEYLDLTQFGGVDFAPDGRIWIGDRGDSLDSDAPSGLFFATSLAEAPTRVDDTLALRCVDYRPGSDEVFVCQPYEAGRIAVDGSGYARDFAFDAVLDFVACDGLDFAPICAEALLGGWCGASHFPQAPLCCGYPDRQGVPHCSVEGGVVDAASPDADAGAAAADSGGDAGLARGAEGDCGCRIARRASPPGGAGLLALLALIALWARRCARRQ